MSKRIYMDNAATTPVKPEVLDAMMKAYADEYGNASSIYGEGRGARKRLEEARLQVADVLGAKPNEIFFTSGGTESDNWAIKGVALANQDKGNHIITTAIEHPAILHTCEWLEKNHGFSVTYLPVDAYGCVTPKQVAEAITDKTVLVSIMYANNEIGTIEPIGEIGSVCREKGVYFHTDAVQAVGHVPIDVVKENIDMLSLSGHKFYGPKGVGVLFVRKGVKIQPLMHGGAQESKRRAGTENVPAIIGLGKAIELAARHMDSEMPRIRHMRDTLMNGLMERIPHARLNGHPTERLPGNVNISFQYIEGEGVLIHLDLQGIAASSGSACTSGSLDPSHVLLAIGLPHEIAHGSLRLSLGDFNTMDDVEQCLATLPPIIQKLRDMSPLYKG